MRKTFVLLVLLLCPVLVQAQQLPDASVSMTMLKGSKVPVVECSIKGVKEACMFDSGASYSLVDERLIEPLGLKSVGSVTVSTVAGDSKTLPVFRVVVKLGNEKEDKIEVIGATMPSKDQYRVIIGNNWMADKYITMDFYYMKLTVTNR